MKTRHHLILSGCVALAACGGSGLEAEPGAANLASAVSWPLLDDEGHFMPSAPQALPEDLMPRHRALRFATAAQAAQLETALGARAVRIDIDGPGGVAAALALGLTASARDVAGLPDGVPVLVHGHDLRLTVQVAEQLADAGLTGVWVVRS